MAFIKCYECGQEISDKTSICPHCGIKIEQKRKSVNIILIAVIIAIFLIASIVIVNIYQSMSYPNVVGSISLNMKQEEVEKILSSEIEEELYYSDLNFESEGANIFVSNSGDSKALSDMNFSKAHQSISCINFYFDAEDKLCEISISTTDKSFKTVCEEYDIDIENITYFYGGAWTKGYIVSGNMYIQVSVVEDINARDGAFIKYKRLSDAENIIDLQK